MKKMLLLGLVLSLNVFAVDKAMLQGYVDSINSDCAGAGVKAKTEVKWDTIKNMDEMGVTFSKLSGTFGTRCIRMKGDELANFNKKVTAIVLINDSSMKESGAYKLALNGSKLELTSNLKIFRTNDTKEPFTDVIINTVK
jgi:hypothetical protein